MLMTLPDPLEDNANVGMIGNTPPLSDDQMMDMMVFATDRIEEMRRRSFLKIWRGPKRDSPLWMWCMYEKPALRISELIADNTIYIMAGVGIIAGVDAFKILDSFVMQLEWSDEYIPLEDQDSDLAKLLLKLEVKQDVDDR